MRKGTSLRVAAAAAVFGLPLAACEAPPPAPPAKVCDPITAEQNDRLQLGMGVGEVEWHLQHKLTRTYYSVIDLSTASLTLETWSYSQDWDVNGCGQYASYMFENGRLVGMSWSEVVK